MRGSIKKRYKGSWSIILDLGTVTDPKTGKPKRKQKWITVQGTKREAENRLTEELRAVNRGEFVEPNKLTVADWLPLWMAKSIIPRKRRTTVAKYWSVINTHLIPKLGPLRLQAITQLDVEQYHATLGLADATGEQHHAILSSALKAAVRSGILLRNVASLATNIPQADPNHEDVARNCWTADQARCFLDVAKASNPQDAAFYSLALDSGCRKSELAALQWPDIDAIKGTVRIIRQLDRGGAEPVYGPVKRHAVRTIDLSAETVKLLQVHKKAQAELKMRNRLVYRDLGLIFAKDYPHLRRRDDHLGEPLGVNNLGQRGFERLMKRAGVPRITLHGLRHTCATLLLAAGVQPHVVQKRLGHKKVEITLNIYAHALPQQTQDAAARLGALLHG